jgi:hypothetical protein
VEPATDQAIPSELDVLLEQLDELVAEGAVDAEDALEIAVVAGLAKRLGADAAALADAEAWRVGPGADLLRELWDDLDEEALVEAVDACATSESTEEELEEAIYDVDEVVAAAIWAGKSSAVKRLSRRVADSIRQVPERFAPIADVGRELARQPAVAEWSDVYDYWFALADAGDWAEA